MSERRRVLRARIRVHRQVTRTEVPTTTVAGVVVERPLAALVAVLVTSGYRVVGATAGYQDCFDGSNVLDNRGWAASVSFPEPELAFRFVDEVTAAYSAEGSPRLLLHIDPAAPGKTAVARVEFDPEMTVRLQQLLRTT